MPSSPEDYKTEVEPVWCPGCGDFGDLAAFTQAMASLQLDPKDICIVSGIGCSGRFSHFIKSYAYHTAHGRALPTAIGVKAANPNLVVFVVGGDGDGFSIGGGHIPHAARRNPDLTYLIIDNAIYGLTKGQVSPTSLTEQKAPSTPWGNLETPLNTLGFAVACGASFVARGASFNTKALTELIVQGIEHPGFAFIDALSPCVVFNNHQEEWKERVTDVAPNHDVSDRVRAFDLALRGGFSLGIVYRELRPTLGDKYRALVDRSKESDLDAMLDGFSARKGTAIGKPVSP